MNELCRTATINLPIYSTDLTSVTIENQRFDCDLECVEFIKSVHSSRDITYRKVHQESGDEYIRQNTALAALHGWGRKINPVTTHLFLSSSHLLFLFLREICISHRTHRMSILDQSRLSSN